MSSTEFDQARSLAINKNKTIRVQVITKTQSRKEVSRIKECYDRFFGVDTELYTEGFEQYIRDYIPATVK